METIPDEETELRFKKEAHGCGLGVAIISVFGAWGLFLLTAITSPSPALFGWVIAAVLITMLSPFLYLITRKLWQSSLMKGFEADNA
jgi:hypothetical protein